MILVLLGTQHNEFTRLLKKIEECKINGIIQDEIIVQAGFTKYETNKMKVFDMISKETLEEYVDKADIIITHGGIGSITMALKKHKKIIAVPRLHKFNEHINDHQIQIVDLFNEKGYLIGIQDVDDLPQALEQIKDFKPQEYQQSNQKMISIIENFIDNI